MSCRRAHWAYVGSSIIAESKAGGIHFHTRPAPASSHRHAPTNFAPGRKSRRPHRTLLPPTVRLPPHSAVHQSHPARAAVCFGDAAVCLLGWWWWWMLRPACVLGTGHAGGRRRIDNSTGRGCLHESAYMRERHSYLHRTNKKVVVHTQTSKSALPLGFPKWRRGSGCQQLSSLHVARSLLLWWMTI